MCHVHAPFDGSKPGSARGAPSHGIYCNQEGLRIRRPSHHAWWKPFLVGRYVRDVAPARRRRSSRLQGRWWRCRRHHKSDVVWVVRARAGLVTCTTGRPSPGPYSLRVPCAACSTILHCPCLAYHPLLFAPASARCTPCACSFARQRRGCCDYRCPRQRREHPARSLRSFPTITTTSVRNSSLLPPHRSDAQSQFAFGASRGTCRCDRCAQACWTRGVSTLSPGTPRRSERSTRSSPTRTSVPSASPTSISTCQSSRVTHRRLRGRSA